MQGKSILLSAACAGMSRGTGSKYLKEGVLPSETRKERTYKTRANPFLEQWEWIEECLVDAPCLEAKTIFEHLLCTGTEYVEGQLRTLQRHIRTWRAHNEPKEVYFPQEHRAGEALQTDFTSANTLNITIDGEPLDHLFCVVTLPYSNYTWATVCYSESMQAITDGLQEALFRLGAVPEIHQTDNSTAATHRASKDEAKGEGKHSKNRRFNERYLALMRHYSMEPRTIGIGKSNQNGDVEAANGALKRCLNQYLIIRRSRDFKSLSDYKTFLKEVLNSRNALRREKLAEELAQMKPLSVKRLPAFTVVKRKVTKWSTIQVKTKSYSLPSSYIGHEVRVYLFESKLEAWYSGKLILSVPQQRGKNTSKIHYAHIIDSLVNKPFAFERYRFREDLFPTLFFRKAYDSLVKKRGKSTGTDLKYLRILNFAAKEGESDVEIALEMLLEAGETPTLDAVKSIVQTHTPTKSIQLSIELPNPQEYDIILELKQVS